MRILAFFFDSLLTELNRVQHRGENIDRAAAHQRSTRCIQRLYAGMRQHMAGIKDASNKWLQAVQEMNGCLPAASP